jgi:decaprenylphospho-beta-D-erythro-pentofuranosid-2-ulose 2-reductase
MKKSVLLLGARSDIGLAIARHFSKHGFDVLLAARNSARLNKEAADMKIRYNNNVSILEFDILNYAALAGFVQNLSVLPDVVVSVVGLLGDQIEDQKNIPNAKLVMETNYIGPVLILSEFANLFEQRGSGCIIGVSSVAGDRGRKSNYFYGSAKAGFTSFLSGLRNRLHSSNVKVITVKPGFVKTAMTEKMQLPKKLTATPEQVAHDVYHAHIKGKDVLYTRWFWRWIMLVINNIPEFIFKRLSL